MKEGFYMKKGRLVIRILIISMCSITLSGCWNYREIDTLAIAAGIAIDKDIKTNKYKVTTEIISTQIQGIATNVSSELYSSEGDSIFSAIRNTIEKTGLKIFWSDAKVLLISESLATEGVIPVIDWISRDSETRSDLWILIAKGNSAEEILEKKIKLKEVVSFHLDDAMKSGETLSKFTDSRLNMFLNEISSEGKAGTAAVVDLEPSDSTIAPRVNGTAIFKSDKLVGYLDGTETLYMLMIKNKIKEGVITLENVSGSHTSITLELFQNRTKLTPVENNGFLSLLIDIYPVVAIDEVEGSKDFMKGEDLEMLQKEAEKKIQTQVEYLINKLQKEYNSDILGFAEIFEKQKPKVSKLFKKNKEDIFQSIKPVVNVHLQIKGSGKTIKPISKGE